MRDSGIEISNAEKNEMLAFVRGDIDPKWPGLRRMLIRVEQALNGGSPVRNANRKYTIEHVLPRSGGHPQWTKILGVTEAEARASARKLGNLCFVSKNDELGEKLFSAKKEIIQETDDESDWRLTADAFKQSEWSIATIDARTERLVKAFMDALDPVVRK
jgi:hypothetical protein